jgi:hypothetical protein
MAVSRNGIPLKSGMKVFIADDISETTRRFSSNDEMHRMKGKRFEIVDTGNEWVDIYMYRFSPKDIIAFPDVDKIKLPEAAKFDIQELII